MVFLKVNKAFIVILSKYANFTDIYSPISVAESLKYIEINNYTIKLIDNKQLFYKVIYNLGSIKLEILKSYTITNLVNSFRRSFKFFANIPIFYPQKPNNSFYLYINHQGHNNFTIKNKYLLLLISEFLD